MFDPPKKHKPESERYETPSNGIANTSQPSNHLAEAISLKDIPPDISGRVHPSEPSYAVSESNPTITNTREPTSSDPQSEQPKTLSADPKPLEKALKDLDAPSLQKPLKKRKSFAFPVLVGTLLLVTVVGVGLYVLNSLEPSSSTISERPPIVPVIKKAPSFSQSVAIKTDNESAQAPSGTSSQTTLTDNLQTTKSITHEGEISSDSQQQTRKEEAQPQPQVSSSTIPLASRSHPDLSSETIEPKIPQQIQHEQKKVLIEEHNEIAQKFKPKQKPAPGLLQKPLPGTFSIHFGSYRTSQVAQGEVRRLKSKGFEAFTEKVDLGDKGIWYRVKVGVYPSKEKATQALRLFLTKEKGDARIVTNR